MQIAVGNVFLQWRKQLAVFTMTGFILKLLLGGAIALYCRIVVFVNCAAHLYVNNKWLQKNIAILWSTILHNAKISRLEMMEILGTWILFFLKMERNKRRYFPASFIFIPK